MFKFRLLPMVMVVFLLISTGNKSVAEEVKLDVPYRNQITSYPNWWNNWASCGYTCMMMSLLYADAVPESMSEYALIEQMNKHCSTTSADGSMFYNWTKTDDFCQQVLPDYNLDVKYIESDYENQIKDELKKGNPVIVGTMIFGGYGHVILIVGYRDDKWLVHDPLNRWGKEVEPPSWWTEEAAYCEYPIESFCCLYGVVITNDFARKYAAKIVDQSPSAIIYDEEMAMLWVRYKNTGREDWEKENIHIGTVNPNDCECILKIQNHPESYRWVGTNRVQMEQAEVGSGNEALFGISVSTNGFNVPIEICFRMVYDDENEGQWFGPVVRWVVDCRQSDIEENETTDISSLAEGDEIYYHRGSVHNHTTWSDGCINVEGLCRQAQNAGLEYVVISDHSDYFDSEQKFRWYVDDINQSMQKTGLCAVAGIEYSMQNYAGQVLEDTHDGRIHILGFGYNKEKETIVPPFFPWSEWGPKTTIKQLVDWHYQHGLPIIVCHPVIRGNDGYSSAELIRNCQFCDPTHVSTVEIFDIGMDTTTWGSIAGKLMWPLMEDLEGMKLYKDYLFPAGCGVSACSDYHGVPSDMQKPEVLGNEFYLTIDDNGNGWIDPGWGEKFKIKVDQQYMRLLQSMDRAKTTYASDFNSVTVNEVVAGFVNKRTIASRYHENLNFLKINGADWAPGIWANNVKCENDVKIEFQVQFHGETGVLDKLKEVGIVRNGKTVADQAVKLDDQDRLNFCYIDTDLPNGIHKYFVVISGLEANDRAQERIITSPIYVEVTDKNYNAEEPEILEDGTMSIPIFRGLIHLGDSNYTTPLNVGFAKKYDEGKVGSWYFDLDLAELANYDQAVLTMTVRGAEKLDTSYYGNPIDINGVQIAECLVKDGNLENNGKYHCYVVPRDLLLNGKNILMIRSMSHLMGGQRIDFDDFELSDIKILFTGNVGTNFTDGAILSAKINDEPAKYELADKKGFSEQEKEKSQEMYQEFVQKGGKIYPKDDPAYNQLAQIMSPIARKMNLFERYDGEDFKVAIFASPTLDPIVLPDGTLLVPDGLLKLYHEELPESFLFPILSQMIQADKGITYEQTNRTDWSMVLGTIGLVASQYTGSGGEIVQAIGSGLLLVAVINLKVEREDYFISDAYALEMLNRLDLDCDDAFSFVDAINTMQVKNPKKIERFYLYAPEATERMKALRYYFLLKECYSLPVKPEEIDWGEALEK